jgi:cell division protein FtsN
VIVECAFVDSTDIALIDTEPERVKVGQAIAQGILKTLGITTAPSTLYRVQVGAYGSQANAEAQKKRLRAAGFDAVIIKA